ncbi:MAG: mannonate dehydratase [Acidobacteriales bacterium]|nr:mannonate dehydratase [Terriglobales bacterium]
MNTFATRRGFGQAALGAATALRMRASAKRPLEPLSPGVKISLQIPANFTDDDLAFAKQMGVGHVSIGTDSGTYEDFASIKQRVEAGGLKVGNIGNASVHNMPEVVLNLPGRDRKIESYKQYLRDLSRAGIYYTTYGPAASGVWSSPAEKTRGGATARAFHMNTATGHWRGQIFRPPFTHGRQYTEDEIWENYTYFIRQVIPVAEECGVRIGVHPDDPPVPNLGGVPRCVFGNFAGFERAFKIANSPNLGVCLCCGTWMEGGKMMGKDVFEAVRAFAKIGKLWKIHLRNVTGPLPDFVETYIDDGYVDMKKLMRTIVESDFRGILIADHVPRMVGDNRTGTAFSIGYIRALHDMAVNELRKG